MEWIPVPPTNVKLLLTIKGENEVASGSYCAGMFLVDGRETSQSVTHWALAPEAATAP